MDKYEYKIKADEIKSLIAQGEYQQAAEIADGIDWRRVKSVMMLCTISDLYKINRRLEDSRDLLLLAYDRHPGGRTIVFSLCELSIKMGDVLQAVEYYKEFVQIAPKDTGRYILQYKLYEAQDVSLEERIAVLEEMKKRDYREKWAYELAYLYHRVGLAAKCVEECDELILWFGEGKYVVKAMELKMLHQSLTPDQQAKYDARFAIMQEELVQEVPAAEPSVQPQTQAVPAEKEDEIHVKTMDVGEYNTINLQKEIAEGLKEVLNAPQDANDAITQSIIAPMLEETKQIPAQEVKTVLAEMTVSAKAEEEVESEVFFGETGEVEVGAIEALQWQASETPRPIVETATEPFEESVVEPSETIVEEPTEEPAKAAEEDVTATTVMEEMRKARQTIIEPPKELAGVLSMESDGQLSLVVPEKEAVEKQITGQISIEDVLAEWERMKKENEEKRKEDLRQRVLQQTGAMFTEFEASVRDGLLEKLEAEKTTPPPVVKLEDMAREEVAEEIAAEETWESLPEEELVGEEIIEEKLPEAEPVEEEIIEEELLEEEPIEEEIIEEELPEEEPIEEEIIEEELLEEEPIEEVVSEEEFVEEMESDGSDFEVEELEEIEDSTEEVSAEDISMEEVSVQESVEEEPIEDPLPQKPEPRTLSREERELFAPFIQGKASKEQLIKVLDGISMAAYTGNVIVTGPEGVNALGLAKNIVRDMQSSDSNFSGKTAKISGSSMNKQDINKLVSDLANGALIVQKATEMSDDAAENLYKALQQEHLGILVVLEDNKKSMNKFLDKHSNYLSCFTARMDVDALSDDALVDFAKKYAREMEYSIDEFGVLALHQRIDEMQTSDHVVTVAEVKEIVDEAIRHANRKNVGHFFDVLLAKRYDEEDMIILREKDFI